MRNHADDQKENEVENMKLAKEYGFMNMIRLLQFIVIGFGINEVWNALKYHKQQKKIWAVASLCIGIFACACAIISMTGIL